MFNVNAQIPLLYNPYCQQYINQISRTQQKFPQCLCSPPNKQSRTQSPQDTKINKQKARLYKRVKIQNVPRTCTTYNISWIGAY